MCPSSFTTTDSGACCRCTSTWEDLVCERSFVIRYSAAGFDDQVFEHGQKLPLLLLTHPANLPAVRISQGTIPISREHTHLYVGQLPDTILLCQTPHTCTVSHPITRKSCLQREDMPAYQHIALPQLEHHNVCANCNPLPSKRCNWHVHTPKQGLAG
eukprot:3843130-Rhodomonas_salina.1